MVVGLDDIAVMERHEDRSFRGPNQSRKTGLESGGLDFIQDLQADRAPDVAVVRLPNLGHAALTGAAEEIKTLLHVDAL